MKNLYILTASFCFLFAAYNTLQSYVSSTLPGNLGFISLTTLYASYVLSLFVTPAFLEYFGDWLSMFLGEICYVIFIASLLTENSILIVAASVIIGFGAAILWVGQGFYITKISSEENRGQYSGIFWGGMQSSGIIGPLVSYIALTHVAKHSRNVVMYLIFTFFGCVAVLLLLLISKASPVQRDEERLIQNQNDSSPRSLYDLIIRPLHGLGDLFRDKNVLFLLLPCFFTGLEMGFSNGEVFRLSGLDPCYSQFDSKSVCENASLGCSWRDDDKICGKDESVISLVFIAFGIGDCFGGIILGRISDWYGSRSRKLVVTFGAICYGVALLLTYYLKSLHDDLSPIFPFWGNKDVRISYMWYLAAVLYGLTDASFNTQIYASLGSLYPEHASLTFTIYQVFQQLGGIFSFSLPIALPLEDSNIPIFIQAGFLITSFVSFIFVKLKEGAGGFH